MNTRITGGLQEAAKLNDDAALLVHISGDCVAKEIRYHRSCHRKYVRAATYKQERYLCCLITTHFKLNYLFFLKNTKLGCCCLEIF